MSGWCLETWATPATEAMTSIASLKVGNRYVFSRTSPFLSQPFKLFKLDSILESDNLCISETTTQNDFMTTL